MWYKCKLQESIVHNILTKEIKLFNNVCRPKKYIKNYLIVSVIISFSFGLWC